MGRGLFRFVSGYGATTGCMTEPSRTTIRQRLYAFLIAGLGGLAASAFSFSLAVYKAAHPPRIPEAAAGEQIETGRWLVTLRSARNGAVPPTGVPPWKPTRLVMVDMDVVNRSAAPSNLLSRIVSIEGLQSGAQLPTAYLDRDKGFAGYLNPDMPERVTLAWEWPENDPVPQTLKLTVNGQIYKLRDNLYGASGWYDGDAVAAVELPVEATP